MLYSTELSQNLLLMLPALQPIIDQHRIRRVAGEDSVCTLEVLSCGWEIDDLIGIGNRSLRYTDDSMPEER